MDRAVELGFMVETDAHPMDREWERVKGGGEEGDEDEGQRGCGNAGHCVRLN